MKHRRAATSTLEELLAGYRATRDPAVLGRAFDAAAPGLFRLALAWTPDAATAEDVVQETFLAAFAAIDRWDARRPAMPWLAGILRHKAARARRRLLRTPAALPELPPSLAPGAQDDAARREVAERVRAAIARLREPYRSVALLRWRHGLAPAEIAELRDEPPGTVRSTLTRALALLRKELRGLAAIALPWRTDHSTARGLRAVRRAVVRGSVGRAAVGVLTAAAIGGVAMATKKQIVLASCGVVLLAAGWWVGDCGDGRPAASSDRSTAPDAESRDRRVEAKTASRLPAESPGPTHAPEVKGDAVRGHVVDRSGDPIPGARVAAFPDSIERAFDPATGRTVTTGPDGAFAVAGLGGPAPYVVAAQAHGFAPRTRTGVCPPGDVTIVLGACATLEGRVLGPADAPVAGARVRVSGVLPGGARFEGSSVSGEGGAYRVTNLPPIARPRTSPDTSISVLVLADGYAPLLVADVLDSGSRALPDLAEGAAIRLDLHVVRGATVTGRAIDATGRPVEGARVALMSYERPLGLGRFSDQPRHLGTTTSASDGSFRFAAVPAAGVHRPAILGDILPFGAVVAVGPDGATGCVLIPILRDGESHAVEIALVPVAWVTGRVVDEAGVPVADAVVSARSEKGRQMPATFRSAGDVDVPCPHATSGADGRFRAAVPLTADAGTRLLVGAATPAAGMSPYRSSAEVSVAIPSQGAADVGDIVLRAEPTGVHADVEVVDDNGRPVRGARFRSRDELHLPYGQWGWPATDADGRSRLRWQPRTPGDVPPGPAPREVVVTAPGFAAAVVQVTFDVVDRDAQHIQLVPGRHVAGRVRWSDGRPAADAWVLVVDGAVPLADAVPPPNSRRAPPERHPAAPGLVVLGRVRTEADGSFRVDDLPDRPYLVVARSEPADAARTAPADGSLITRSDVRPGTDDIVLVLPPLSEAQPAVAASLDVRVIEDATGRPLAGAAAELFDGTTILYGAAAGEGRVRFDAVPRGDWTLRAGSARFGRAFVGGVRADDAGGERVVRVARGATVRGRLEDAGGPGLVHLIADDAAVPWFWSPSALVSADGAFALDGVPAGRYRVAVTRNSNAADAVACPDALEVRPGDADVTFASRVPAARR